MTVLPRPKGLGWWRVICDDCEQHVRWERYPIQSARCLDCASLTPTGRR